MSVPDGQILARGMDEVCHQKELENLCNIPSGGKLVSLAAVYATLSAPLILIKNCRRPQQSRSSIFIFFSCNFHSQICDIALIQYPFSGMQFIYQPTRMRVFFGSYVSILNHLSLYNFLKETDFPCTFSPLPMNNLVFGLLLFQKSLRLSMLVQ